MNNSTHHATILFANFSIDRRRRCVTELTAGIGARRERLRASVTGDNLRARRSRQRSCIDGTLTTSALLVVAATTLRRLLKVCALLFGDRVHVVATQAHARSSRTVVWRRPRYSPLRQQIRNLWIRAVAT
jgi:hypothetical protein